MPIIDIREVSDSEQMELAKQLQELLIALRAVQNSAQNLRGGIQNKLFTKDLKQRVGFIANWSKNQLDYFRYMIPEDHTERLNRDTDLNSAIWQNLINIAKSVNVKHLDEFEAEMEAAAAKYAYKEYK